MIKHLQDTFTLNNGVKMPGFGLGVFRVEEGSQVYDAVRHALDAGYRHIDTAAAYENEVGVGKALQASGIPREEVFITSKLWNRDQGYESTFKAYETSIEKLGLEQLDLYLIHWPVKEKYVESWRALVELYEAKKVRAIGVSNFHVHHLNDIMATSSVTPALNQIELHPLLSQVELRTFCKEKGIVVQAWSPIMKGNLDLPVLTEIAERHNKSNAQVVLRWHVQHEIIAIPKSVNKERIIENSQIFDFSLSAEEMTAIDNLNQNQRFGSDPDNFNF